MRSTKSINKNVVLNKKVIIYGAGTCGEIALLCLREWGCQPFAFCDENEQIMEKSGIQVIRPTELKYHTDAVVIIAALNYFYEMKSNCIEFGIKNFYDMEELFNVSIDEELLSYQAQDVFANKARYIDIVNHSPDESRLCIGKLELTVSEKCSLKCRDCSYLMPYYISPQDSDVESCINSLNLLLELVDRISELRLLGGEPFVNRNLWKIINAYKTNEKIGIIDIHTNGTVLPSKENLEVLKCEKVVVHISDYAVKNNKIEELVKLLKENNIRYFVRKYDEWLVMGQMEYKNYNAKSLIDAYKKCTSRKCLTLKDGRIYTCPRSAHATAIGCIPDFKEDYFAITDKILNQPIKERERLSEFVTRQVPVKACMYCLGGNVNEKVAAAVQI